MTKQNNNKQNDGWFSSWPSLIFFCILLPLAFRALFFTPFHIPSGSMKPTLLIGDFLFVSKATYGYSKYSFPFGIEFFNNRLESNEPERGDVVVFRPARMPRVDFIKRVVGLSGDSIQVRDGKLYINGQIVARRYIDDYIDTKPDGSQTVLKRYIETLPNGVSYYILDETPKGRLDNTPIYIVPEDNYFMMGDNRDNSADSRATQISFVPRENLVGRAEVIFLSVRDSLWKIWQWAGNFREDRWFKNIQFERAE